MTTNVEQCTAGYYCDQNGDNTFGTTSKRPINLSTEYGDICPPGKYCEAGSTDGGLACPDGTFSDGYGLAADSECSECPLGKVCKDTDSSGIIYDDMTDCPATKFCPVGMT